MRTREEHRYNHGWYSYIPPPPDINYWDESRTDTEIIYICKSCESRHKNNLLQIEENKKRAKKEKWLNEKTNLTDVYLKRYLRLDYITICENNNVIHAFYELVRETIKLKNLIKDKKAPLVICKSHGRLYLEDVLKAGQTVEGKTRYKCRDCYHKVKHNYYLNNKQKLADKQRKYKHDKRLKRLQLLTQRNELCESKI